MSRRGGWAWLRLTALAHGVKAAYMSAVVRVALKGSTLSPVYLHLFVSPASAQRCPSSPSAALVAFHYPSLSYAAYPLKTQKRRDLAHRLQADLVAALDVPPSTLRLTAIDPVTQRVEALLTPPDPRARWHPHQWFLGEGVGGAGEAVVEKARGLQAQVKDAGSAWRRRGSTGREVDREKGVQVTAVPFSVDATPRAEADSVWTDEREVDQWERSHEGGGPVSPPPASNASEADPYEAIAVRISESFEARGEGATVRGVVGYVATTLAMVGGGLWLLFWWRSRGQRFPPSFGLWVREGAEWLVRGSPVLVDPAQGQKVGQALKQQAQALVG